MHGFLPNGLLFFLCGRLLLYYFGNSLIRGERMKLKCNKCEWICEGRTVAQCVSQLGEHNILKHNMPRKEMRVEIKENKVKFITEVN